MANPTQYFGDSVFWIEIEKIKPNPYQPRREFDDDKLRDLAESIRMYGILQPLIVTRHEFEKPDGGIAVEYELISGERRLRASKVAGLSQVPALIRSGENDPRIKLELAIIENLQREDINVVDRARAFERLVKEFNLKHIQVAEKVGKSREYVSNTMRILALPEEILNAVSEGKVAEGHTRPLLMLVDYKEEQMTLFKEIVFRKISVREAESIARRTAQDRVRKKDWSAEPDMLALETKFKEMLGTKVTINKVGRGGRITIDFYTASDVHKIIDKISERVITNTPADAEMNTVSAKEIDASHAKEMDQYVKEKMAESISNATPLNISNTQDDKPIDDRSKEEINKEENEEIYSIKNFGI